MPFDEEDRALTDRLKKKYEGRVVDRTQEEAMNGGMGVDVAEIAAFQRKEDARRLEEMKDSSGGAAARNEVQIEVKLCMFCQGVGSVKEQYGPRELTRHCENCDGEGTIRYGARAKAKPVAAPMVKRMTLEINSHKRSTLHKSIDKIERQLETYRGEIDELVSKMHSAQVQGEEERECLADLVNKMQAHMNGLRDKVASKRAELGKLGPCLEKVDKVDQDSILMPEDKVDKVDEDEGALQEAQAGSTPTRSADYEDRRMAEEDGKEKEGEEDARVDIKVEEEEEEDEGEEEGGVDSITPPESICVTEASSPDATFVTQAEPNEEKATLSEDQSTGGEQDLLAEVDTHMIHLTGLMDKGNNVSIAAVSGNNSLNDLD